MVSSRFARAVSMVALASATLRSAAASSALSRSSAARDCLSAVSATSRASVVPAPFVSSVWARSYSSCLSEIGLVADDRAARRVDVLLGDVELAHPLVERRPRDRDLLLVVGVVDPGEDRPGLDRLPFVERQFDDAGLDRLEAEDALVRLDVAGDDNRVEVGRPIDPGQDDVPPPGDDDVPVTIGRETAETQRRNHKEKEGESPDRQEPIPLASPLWAYHRARARRRLSEGALPGV